MTTKTPRSLPPSSEEPPIKSGGDDDVARLRLAIARLARLQRQAAGSGLTQSQQSALSMIDRHGPIQLRDLAEVEQVTPPTITRIVAKLNDQGLVRRDVDPADRRIVRVEMTGAGRRRLEEARARRNEWLSERLDALSGTDADAIIAAVGALERLAFGGVEADTTC